MKPEYIIKIGELFVTEYWMHSGRVDLSSKQFDAKRLDDIGLVNMAKFLTLHNVPYKMFRVDGTVTVVNKLPQVQEEKVSQ